LSYGDSSSSTRWRVSTAIVAQTAPPMARIVANMKKICTERNVSLNVVLEADSLSLQTRVVSEGGVYALLGPYAIAGASKDCRLQSARLVDPVVTRHIALAMSRHVNLTLACRTVMQLVRDIAKSGAAGLRRR
jgi:LysR family nitrogen assimilation transcriptional regulator